MKHVTNQSSYVGDLMASMVLFIIALPLSLGIAMASGAPAASAIVAIVIGGLVVGLLSGAPLVVSGPAAGLSALVLQFVSQYGLPGLMIITTLAGLIQITLGTFRLGQAIRLIPKTVLEGVLSAIGLVIVLGQLHILAGHPIPGGALKCLAGLPSTFASAIGNPGSLAFQALTIGILAIVIQIAWKRWAPAALKVIPPALPAVIIATLIGMKFDIPRVELQAIGSYTADSLQTFTTQVAGLQWFHLLGPAIGLALVASAESLLTAKATDLLAQKHHIKTDLNINRELIAQGAGNTISGIFGGIPVSGVMVRSAANVESGARTRYSTMLHSVWVISFVLFLPALVSKLPSTALAAVLILTGINLINFKHMVQAVRNNAREAYLWPVTAMAIMSTDLLKGLIAGLGIALADHAYRKLTAKKNGNNEVASVKVEL